jgi:hypothetical protein
MAAGQSRPRSPARSVEPYSASSRERLSCCQATKYSIARWSAERIRAGLPMGDVTERATLAALKLYLAIRDDLDQEHDVLSTGINCLNESGFSDTTPCLAWDLLHQERDMIWGCEADTVSMLTHFLMHRSLRLPIMMSNLYPFLMGQAAIKHERSPAFPMVDEPENHVLAAHCG